MLEVEAAAFYIPGLGSGDGLAGRQSGGEGRYLDGPKSHGTLSCYPDCGEGWGGRDGHEHDVGLPSMTDGQNSGRGSTRVVD